MIVGDINQKVIVIITSDNLSATTMSNYDFVAMYSKGNNLNLKRITTFNVSSQT